MQSAIPPTFSPGENPGIPPGENPEEILGFTSPRVFPLGKSMGFPWGAGAPRGNPLAGPHFLWDSEMGNTILEKTRAGSERNGNPMPLTVAGLGFHNSQGPPPGENPEENHVEIFLGITCHFIQGFPRVFPWGKVGPPWGKVPPPTFPPEEKWGAMRTHGENPTENPG